MNTLEDRLALALLRVGNELMKGGIGERTVGTALMDVEREITKQRMGYEAEERQNAVHPPEGPSGLRARSPKASSTTEPGGA